MMPRWRLGELTMRNQRWAATSTATSSSNPHTHHAMDLDDEGSSPWGGKLAVWILTILF